MVALVFILACIAALSAVFTVVIRQMAKAHRQHYLEEVAVNELACASPTEPERKAAYKARPRARSAGSRHGRVARGLAARLHSGPIMR
ncbi:hypothetical protein QTA58_07565 [Neorhizobium sp. CSC1952]|uniref:hypothetical protein n=1 Tax=Neorhizobium sp. CSC1952 TaxID=2978974 RepID=UPI0025A55EE2|nr:hypothetical protein [Rhizobium sp. CSC1952]WJR68596.1 hypothetical protein QTA58_07565 [Rhizobium sp. CSC1952]